MPFIDRLPLVCLVSSCWHPNFVPQELRCFRLGMRDQGFLFREIQFELFFEEVTQSFLDFFVLLQLAR